MEQWVLELGPPEGVREHRDMENDREWGGVGVEIPLIATLYNLERGQLQPVMSSVNQFVIGGTLIVCYNKIWLGT